MAEEGVDEVYEAPPQYSPSAPAGNLIAAYDKDPAAQVQGGHYNDELEQFLKGQATPASNAPASAPPPVYNENTYEPDLDQELAQKGWAGLEADAQLITPIYADYKYQRTNEGGLLSLDERLTGVGELAGFFASQNNKPSVGIMVKGWHTERRTTGSGKNRRTRRVTVTDWVYNVDLTPFILPLGYMQPLGSKQDGQPNTIRSVLQEYIDNGNALKTMTMRKTVEFDFAFLCQQVTMQIRARGWGRRLTVKPIFRNHVVQVRTRNCMSQAYSSDAVKCLCFVTCLCIIFYPLSECYKKDFTNALRSNFRMTTDAQTYWMMYGNFFNVGGFAGHFVQPVMMQQQPMQQQMVAAPAAQSAPASPKSWMDELKDLAQLRDDGILTEAEFEQQKAVIMAKKA